MTSVQGRVAVVTGASSGIGAATALALARRGATVVLAARRSERLRRIEAQIPTSCLAIETDVCRPADVEYLFAETVRQFDRVDILVSSAGVFQAGRIDQVTVDEWDRMIDVNIKGLVHSLAHALPLMLSQGSGHIVGIGSLSGRRVKPGNSVYSGTKFAVRAILEGLRRELACDDGVRVSQVSPGVVDTEFASAGAEGGSDQGSGRGFVPLSADVVADTVLHVLTQPANVTTGDVLLYPTGQEY